MMIADQSQSAREIELRRLLRCFTEYVSARKPKRSKTAKLQTCSVHVQQTSTADPQITIRVPFLFQIFVFVADYPFFVLMVIKCMCTVFMTRIARCSPTRLWWNGDISYFAVLGVHFTAATVLSFFSKLPLSNSCFGVTSERYFLVKG